MPEMKITADAIPFKLRFNTQHGDTDLYWRVIIIRQVHDGKRQAHDDKQQADEEETEYLVRSVVCEVATHSDASFDMAAGKIKYNMAGVCGELTIDGEGNALLR